MKSSLHVLLLVVVVATAAWHRVERATMQPGWPDPAQVHRSEAAVHYRYAALLAENGVVPAVDPAVETPVGVEPTRDFTLLLEWIVGTSARCARVALDDPLPLTLVVAWVVAVLTASSIGWVFLVSRSLHGSWGAAWLSALVMLVAVPNWLRGSGAFIRENVAVPLALAALWLGLEDLRRPTGRARALLVAALVAFLCSWHLAGFVVMAAILPAWIGAFVRRADSRLLWSVSVAALVAGALSEPLASRGFLWTGAGAVLLVGGPVGWCLGRWGRAVVLLPAVALAWMVAAGGDYGHVPEVLLARLTGRSADEMSWVARAFSSGPFAAMTLHHFLERLAVPLLAALAGWGVLIGARRRGPEWAWLACVTIGFGVCTFLMTRFSVLWIPALAIAAGAAWARPAARWAGLVALALGLHVMGAWASGSGWLQWIRPLAVVTQPQRVPIPEASRAGVYRWLSDNTAADAVVLADFVQSPTILLATGRSIALHPMFERALARDRAGAYHEAMLGPVESMERFCEAVAADYLVLDVNVLVDDSSLGLRGLSGVGDIPTGASLTRLWFVPEEVPWARPVYRDSWSVIFALDTGERPSDGDFALPSCPGQVAFDEARYPGLLTGSTLSSDHLQRMRMDLFAGVSLLRQCVAESRRGVGPALAACVDRARFYLPCHPLLDVLARETVTADGSGD